MKHCDRSLILGTKIVHSYSSLPLGLNKKSEERYLNTTKLLIEIFVQKVEFEECDHPISLVKFNTHSRYCKILVEEMSCGVENPTIMCAFDIV